MEGWRLSHFAGQQAAGGAESEVMSYERGPALQRRRAGLLVVGWVKR